MKGPKGTLSTPIPNGVIFRQEDTSLIAERTLGGLARLGTPPVAVVDNNPALWGSTIKNKIATWRSGLGLSADRRYLMYVAGDGLTVPTLAQALVDAGADRGMQLDINSSWPRFVTYAATRAGSAPIATKLLNGMVGDTHQFLRPDSRDFFYLTERS